MSDTALFLSGLGAVGAGSYLAHKINKKDKERKKQEKAASWQFRLIDEHNKSKFVRAMQDHN